MNSTFSVKDRVKGDNL